MQTWTPTPAPSHWRASRTESPSQGAILIIGALAAVSVSARAEDLPLADPLWVVDRASAAIVMNQPQGLTYDAVGDLVWVADTGNHRIRVFDGEGMHVRSYDIQHQTSRGPIPGEPRSLLVSREGFVFVLDAMTEHIQVLDLLGERVREVRPGALAGWTPPSAAAAQEPAFAASRNFATGQPAPTDETTRPVAMAFDPQDRLVLAVGGTRGIILGLTAEEQVEWTLDGTEDGGLPFGAISSLFVDPAGNLYVTDMTGPTAVRVFDPEHKQRLALGAHDVGNENFSLPTSVVAASGRMWVADAIRQTIKVFDLEGTLVGMVGGAGRGMGDLLYPAALATDGKNRLFTIERVGARLSAFQMSVPGSIAEATNPGGRDSVAVEVGVDGLGGRTDILAPEARRETNPPVPNK